MKQSYQLIVIGAGPAGMAAAQTAASHGVEVLVLDDQARPGGQIYRNIDASPVDSALLGRDYALGAPLVRNFRQASVEYHPNTSVWYLDRTRQLGVLQQGYSKQITARRIIIASGAQERPLPFPGWELPGVMTAGAGQILLKSAAMVPQDGVILAGSGPLLLLLAWQYLRAGVGIGAILETTPNGAWTRALRHLPRALAASEYLIKGLQMTLAIRRARIPWYKNVRELHATGDARLQAVNFTQDRQSRRIETSLLLVHQGVIPEVHNAQAAACELEWNQAQHYWQPRLDNWGESSQSGIFIAGDAAGIMGARAAHLHGQLAGLQVAHQLGFLANAKRDKIARPIINARNRQLAIRPMLDAIYRPDDSRLEDETLACRCEEVRVREIREVIALGCSGPNQAKAFTRCGMGPCQGRFCAAIVEQIFAQERSTSRPQTGRYTARPPLKPITLGQLANQEAEP